MDGFNPTAGNGYSIVTYASQTGGSSLSFLGLSNGRFAFFQPTVNSTSIVLNTTTSAADLAAQPFSVPADGSVGQTIEINYQVDNLSSTAANPSWFDSFYLSTSQTLNANAVLLGRVQQTTGVAGNSSYSNSLSATLPSLAPTSYWVIEVADSQGLVPVANRANTTIASGNPILLSVPSFSVSAPVTGTIAAGQDLLYQINLPADQNAQINVGSNDVGAVELYEGYQQPPTESKFDQQAFEPTQTSQTISLSGTQAGTYYVLIQGSSMAGSGVQFTLSAQTRGFAVTGLSTYYLAFEQGYTATLTITGTDFTPSTTVSLFGQYGAHLTPSSSTFVNSNTLWATFTFLVNGSYTVQATDGAQTATLAKPLNVDFVDVYDQASFVPPLYVSVSTPSVIRPPFQNAIATITYTNTTGTDLPAPMLEISAPNTLLRLPDQTSFTPDAIFVLATNPDGPAGVLPPEATGTIEVQFQPETVQAHLNTSISAEPVTGPTVFSQSSAASLVNSLIPSSLPAAAAAAVANNLTARLFTNDGPGDFQSDIQSDLDADATYLSELGETGTYDVSLLMAFEVEMATDFGAVEQENTPGIFGLGVPDPTLTALTDSAGNVTIVEGGVGIIGYFTVQSDGSYQAAPGVSNTLTLSNGVYQDRLAGGTDVVFNENGSLNSIEQANGDTLNAGYTGDLLTTLTDSFNGDVTSFAYGSQGLVTKYTDPQGRVAAFTYDANQRLMSTTSSQGTTSFTYVNGSDPASENAIASITNPDGTQQDFTYDSLGP